MEASRDQLLQDLIHREKAVVAKVEAARAEAERIVVQARGEARNTVDAARRSADEHVRLVMERAEVEAKDAREEVLAAARKAVEGLTRKAGERRDAAVRLVMERVLP